MLSSAAQREFDRLAVKIPLGSGSMAVAKYHRQEGCRVLDMARVLVVEDSEDVLDLLRLQLEGIGYAIDTATNGSVALEVAQHTQPDIIVSDLRMRCPD